MAILVYLANDIASLAYIPQAIRHSWPPPKNARRCRKRRLYFPIHYFFEARKCARSSMPLQISSRPPAISS